MPHQLTTTVFALPRSVVMNIRGFRRETRGFRKEIGPELSRSVIAFCHDLFQKDSPHLVKDMEEVAKKPPASSSSQEQEAPRSQRKRRSSAGSQDSSAGVELQEAQSRTTSRKKKKKRPSASDRASTPRRDHQIAEQKQDPQAYVPAVASLPARPEISGSSLPGTDAANIRGVRQQQPDPLLQQTIEHQLLLQNLRSSALQNTQDLDTSLQLLLRNQQRSDSHLQRSIITASLAQQQQLQEQELQQRRAALAAAATSNQAILDATATERLLQLRRSAAGQGTHSQIQRSLQPALLPQADLSRLAQQRSRDSNSQLIETLLLFELQRQQQGAPQNQPPNQNRQFPPFG